MSSFPESFRAGLRPIWKDHLNLFIDKLAGRRQKLSISLTFVGATAISASVPAILKLNGIAAQAKHYLCGERVCFPAIYFPLSIFPPLTDRGILCSRSLQIFQYEGHILYFTDFLGCVCVKKKSVL